VMVAFLDVGGTLWPDSWPSYEGDREERVGRLRAQVQGVSHRQAADLVDVLSQVKHPPSLGQETHQLVEAALRRGGLSRMVAVEAAVEAMCLPAAGRVELFPGAGRLVRGLAAQGRVVIASNTLWRGRQALQRDFRQVGLAEHVSDYVMSIDVGWRKPHFRFFDAAMAAGGAAPNQCVFIGDSETNDIEPANARGITTIRVAIEVPRPSRSAARHVCVSLDEVLISCFSR
jgi:HAD superfamily hydrolase (TIGR01509 family)